MSSSPVNFCPYRIYIKNNYVCGLLQKICDEKCKGTVRRQKK